MRAQTILSILAVSVGFVAADFHYGTIKCAEAQGGYYEGGFILDAASTNLCLSADAADVPGNNIPIDSTAPSGTVCGSNVTIDLESLTWASGSDSGSCTSTAETSVCNPPFAECHYTDVVVCASSICDD